MPPLNILIIGAGIGGPAAAIGLARSGHSVTLYERATTTGGVGYAFRITPNSDRCLKHLGIDAEAGGAVSANQGRMMDVHGAVLTEIKENESEKARKGTSVFAYRPQLHEQLLAKAKACGVVLRAGVKVKSVDVEETSVLLEDGETVHADLIIAADGVHSIVRPAIVDGNEHFPRASTGHNAFRFMISRDAVHNERTLSATFSDNVRFLSWAGPGKRILVYPVDFGRQYNITCTHPEKLSDQARKGDEEADVAYDQKVSAQTVFDIYSEFDEVATRILKLADPKGFRIWKLMDMDEIPRWSKGRVVLIGDACHPVSPFGFSGASMSIEDAVTLATLLPAETAIEEIPGRLRLYEDIRKPRVGRVRDTSRRVAAGEDNNALMMPYRQFLSSYDAYAEARKALEEHSLS